jgi:hypothetical protein
MSPNNHTIIYMYVYIYILYLYLSIRNLKKKIKCFFKLFFNFLDYSSAIYDPYT